MFRQFILFGVLLLSALKPASSAVLELYPEAWISDSVVRLKDIAHVDVDADGRLGEIPIGTAPRPHYVERLTRAQLGRALESTVPQLRGRLQWTGSKTVAIRTEGVSIEAARLADLAAEPLRKELARQYVKSDIKPIEGMRSITVPPRAQLQVRRLAKPVSRRTAMWIDVSVDGRGYSAVPIWFDVQAWKLVPVARTDIAAGSSLKAEDFAMEFYDVLQGSNIVADFPQTQAHLRSALAQGMPLTEEIVEATPAISRNQEVAVRIATGSIVIETSGIAQGSGHIGQSVKVKNPRSSEIFMAKVLEPGVVAVNAR